jgi:uncharacterized repeat protein (TIGR04138 family)
MLGQPDPVFPVRYSGTIATGSPGELERAGFVSLWVGRFASVEEAEAYFGIPDEIGVCLPAEAFARDFGLGNFPPEKLEANFEQLTPRPVRELLQDATFAGSFLDRAVEAAVQQGISEAQGVALLYDFDYRRKPERCDEAGPVRFIAAFPYVRLLPEAPPRPVGGPDAAFEVAAELGYPRATVLFVLWALSGAATKHRRERGSDPEPLGAREYCEYLLSCRGEDTRAVLRELGLRRSEDVGRILFALINKGLARRHESDKESDFDGLFVLE